MKQTREQIKKRLLEKAEQRIDQLLDWNEATIAPDLTAIEDEILQVRKQLSQEMAEALLTGQEASQPVEAECPKCGKRARYKGMRRVGVESRVGPLEIERGYYYCMECRQGFFPPG
jgi:hypothetical protein